MSSIMNVPKPVVNVQLTTVSTPPVSSVFHTEATVSIGSQKCTRCEHPFHNIRCPCCEAERALFGITRKARC